jgi:hypothetical protein
MSSNSEKTKTTAAPAKVAVVKKTRTSLPKLFLRTVYWVLILAILAVVLYITADTVLTIYKHTAT